MRNLEDYWFLSSKGLLGMNMLAQQIGNDLTDSLDVDGNELSEKEDEKKDSTGVRPSGNPNDPHDMAYYLKDLPKNQDEIDSMMNETSVSLLNAAYIFYDGIHNLHRHDVVKSIEVYGEMHRYIPVIAKWAGFNKIGEKVVQHRKREFGVTKFGLNRFVNGYPIDRLAR